MAQYGPCWRCGDVRDLKSRGLCSSCFTGWFNQYIVRGYYYPRDNYHHRDSLRKFRRKFEDHVYEDCEIPLVLVEKNVRHTTALPLI